MLDLDIEIPTPSRYVSNATVDEIALEANRAYRSKSGNARGFPVNMEKFVDFLEVSTLWEDIDEPEGATFFASYTPDGDGLITINEKHKPLFDQRPDVFGACLAHESGHRLLRHAEIFRANLGSPSLFAPEPSPEPIFHRSSWYQYGLTHEEVEKSKEARKRLNEALVKNVWVSDTAHQTLKQIHTHFEPEWVFWQAEHFSLCLRTPFDRVMEQLERAWDFTTWRSIYSLAELFAVSASMMKTRLVKLDVVEIDSSGRPHPKATPRQTGLF